MKLTGHPQDVIGESEMERELSVKAFEMERFATTSRDNQPPTFDQHDLDFAAVTATTSSSSVVKRSTSAKPKKQKQKQKQKVSKFPSLQWGDSLS